MMGFLVLLLGIVLAFWLIGNVMGFLLMLIIAGLVGFAADALVPGEQLGDGWLGAVGVGLLGSWVGSALIGRLGPVLMGVPIIPALLGAVVCVALLALARSSGFANQNQ